MIIKINYKTTPVIKCVPRGAGATQIQQHMPGGGMVPGGESSNGFFQQPAARNGFHQQYYNQHVGHRQHTLNPDGSAGGGG